MRQLPPAPAPHCWPLHNVCVAFYSQCVDMCCNIKLDGVVHPNEHHFSTACYTLGTVCITLHLCVWFMFFNSIISLFPSQRIRIDSLVEMDTHKHMCDVSGKH